MIVVAQLFLENSIEIEGGVLVASCHPPAQPPPPPPQPPPLATVVKERRRSCGAMRAVIADLRSDFWRM